MNIDKLMKDIQKVKPGRYGCNLGDLSDVCDASGGYGLEAAANCFLFGFIQGRKAERAAMELKVRKEADTDAPGYGLLYALVKKHRTDEDFTRVMSSIALLRDTRNQRQKEVAK